MIHACVKKTWNWFLILYRVSLFSLFLSHRHVRKQELNGPGICVIVSLCQLYFNLAYATLKCAKCVNRMKQLNSVQHQLQRDKPCAFILRLHAFLKSFAAPFCMSLLMFFLLWVDVHNLNKVKVLQYRTNCKIDSFYHKSTTSELLDVHYIRLHRRRNTNFCLIRAAADK